MLSYIYRHILDRYGLSGGDILDASGATGGELAVRLAIGETHVLQDNREYFLAHGVDINVLESALHKKSSDDRGNKGQGAAGKGKQEGGVKRSGTTMLIKNLPHDLIPDELEDMFARCVGVIVVLYSIVSHTPVYLLTIYL